MTTQITKPIARPMTTTATPEATSTYAGAYAQLAAIAERLKTSGTATSIDTLVQDVRAARTAHAVCRARLAAVRAEIDAELASADEGSATTAHPTP